MVNLLVWVLTGTPVLGGRQRHAVIGVLRPGCQSPNVDTSADADASGGKAPTRAVGAFNYVTAGGRGAQRADFAG